MSANALRRIRLGSAFGVLIFMLALGLHIPAKLALVGSIAIGVFVGFAAKIR